MLRAIFHLLGDVLRQPAPERWGWWTKIVALLMVVMPSAMVLEGSALFMPLYLFACCWSFVKALHDDAFKERLARELVELRAEDVLTKEELQRWSARVLDELKKSRTTDHSR